MRCCGSLVDGLGRYPSLETIKPVEQFIEADESFRKRFFEPDESDSEIRFDVVGAAWMARSPMNVNATCDWKR